MEKTGANDNFKKRKVWIDYLRIVSAFAVVMIHVIYQGRLRFWTEADTTFYLTVFNLLCFAVPIFIMITGYLQLNPEKEYNLKKSLIRIILALCIFGVLYAWIELIFNEHCISLSQIVKAIINVLQGKSWAHLWYLYMLIGLYLILPFLRTWIKHANDREIKYFLLLNLFFNCILVRLDCYGISTAFHIPIATLFPFYLVLGYYLGNYKRKISNRIICIAWCVCLISLYLISSLFNVQFDALHYNNIITVVLAILVFLTFKNLSEIQGGRYIRVCINSCARCSFGIYILHMIFINVLYD